MKERLNNLRDCFAALLLAVSFVGAPIVPIAYAQTAPAAARPNAIDIEYQPENTDFAAIRRANRVDWFPRRRAEDRACERNPRSSRSRE